MGALPRLIGVVMLLAAASTGKAQPATAPASQPAPRQVLLLNSFERGSAAENLFAGMLRAELSRQFHAPINFFEVSLQPALKTEHPHEGPVVDYLLATFGQRMDLVITLGGPAAEFAQKYRARIFPATPLLIAAMEQRWVEGRTLAANEAALGVVSEPENIVEDIQRLLPDTGHVFAIIGSSPVEKLWRDELGRRMQRFAPRLTFTWSSDLSFEETIERAGRLPPRSVIFYLLLAVDAHGVAQAEERTLAELHAAANAPMFGLYDFQIGRGTVGGSVLSVDELVRNTASVALRILQGESPGTIATSPQRHGQPTFDWRELRRWNIPEARLPAGSAVLFRQPGVWDQYKLYILGAGALVGLQSTLIAGLVVQRGRRRRTEVALRKSEQQFRGMAERNQDLAGRLINAQEAERTRIARDLHDDVSQRLAGVSIAFSGLKQRLGAHGVGPELQQEIADLQQQTLALARNVRHLSHDLHPAVLRHLGLKAALSAYCSELERAHGVAIRCTAEGDFANVAPAAALCIYRIAQEALRNVVAHAGATRADVQLRQADGHVELTVADDGRGFDAGDPSRKGSGLGLVSIAERAKIAGGTISIVAGEKQGARVHTRIPLGVRANAGVTEPSEELA